MRFKPETKEVYFRNNIEAYIYNSKLDHSWRIRSCFRFGTFPLMLPGWLLESAFSSAQDAIDVLGRTLNSAPYFLQRIQ